jgi:hypothetical protein
VTDCPNCGAEVPDGERICPNCGFDTGESQADDVRRLREEGRIHPGRLGPTDDEVFQPAEGRGEDLEASEGPVDPRETDAGL